MTAKQEIFFVTGKGGVGKSTIAIALAKLEATKGKKVLLAELGEQSGLSHFLDQTVTSNPTPSPLSFDVVLWGGEACLREYVFHYIRIESVVSLFFENPVSRALIRAAPALFDLAIAGKITSGNRHVGPKLEYDLIVVDAYATGHMLALLRAARGMAHAIPFGPMGEQSRAIDITLNNREICQFYLVTLPEELPVSETEDLQGLLEAEFSAKINIVCNRVINGASSKNHEAPLDKFYENYLNENSKKQRPFIERLRKSSSLFRQIPFIYESNCVSMCLKATGYFDEANH